VIEIKDINVNLYFIIGGIIIAYMVYMLFDLINQPIKITKKNHDFYYVAVPFFILICLYFSFRFILLLIYEAIDIQVNKLLEYFILGISLTIMLFMYHKYLSILDNIKEQQEFRKKYPLKKVKE